MAALVMVTCEPGEHRGSRANRQAALRCSQRALSLFYLQNRLPGTSRRPDPSRLALADGRPPTRLAPTADRGSGGGSRRPHHRTTAPHDDASPASAAPPSSVVAAGCQRRGLVIATVAVVEAESSSPITQLSRGLYLDRQPHGAAARPTIRRYLRLGVRQARRRDAGQRIRRRWAADVRPHLFRQQILERLPTSAAGRAAVSSDHDPRRLPQPDAHRFALRGCNPVQRPVEHGLLHQPDDGCQR
eukprot:COSAG01_NODE_2802_length_7049_cov_2.441871_5_plen_244_part_00